MRFFSCFLLLMSWSLVAAAQEGTDDGQAEDQADDAMNRAEQHMDDERARHHFLAGRSLYDAGSFDRAAEEFQEAYRLSNRSELLYNIYLSNRDAGAAAPAAEALRKYLEEMEDVPDRINLESRLRSLEEQVERQEQAEREAEQTREQLEREQQERQEAERAAQRSSADGGSIAPWIVTAAGGALVLIGAITGAVALGEKGTLEDECVDGLCPSTYDDFQSDVDSASTLAIVTDVLLIGGGAALAGGLIWALVASGGSEAEAPPPATASCGLHGCEATVRVSF